MKEMNSLLRKCVVSALSLLWVMGFVCTAYAQNYQFESINSGRAEQTWLYGMNNSGTLVGLTGDLTNPYDGNVLACIIEGETTTTFSAPDALMTGAQDVDTDGNVVGFYITETGAWRGFIRDTLGELTAMHVPDSYHTSTHGINDEGQIVGWYSDGPDMISGIHSFIYVDGEYFLLEDYPGAAGTNAMSINDLGQIAGVFSNSDGTQHGFVYDNGVWTEVSHPGSRRTELRGINNKGEVAGFYHDEADYIHGLKYTEAEGIIVLDPPTSKISSEFPMWSSALDIDDEGNMVGSWNTGSTVLGYLAAPTDVRGLPDSPELAVVVDGNTVGLSWSGVPDADGFSLVYFPYNFSFVANVDLGYVLSYVGDLASGASYYVAVRAYNDSGMGDFSRIVSVVVP